MTAQGFEDYSLYSNMSDQQLLELAIHRSLNESTTGPETGPGLPEVRTTSRFPQAPPPQAPPPPPQTSVHYSSHNPPPQKPPDPEEEPMFKAVRVGDVRTLRDLVSCPGTNLMLPSRPGWLAVHQAAWYGQDACLKVLLSAQPGMINRRTEQGETALLLAVSKVQLPCVQELLARRADADIANRDKETPLYKACERNSAAAAAMLLNHGVDVNAHCILGCTALQEAAVQNSVELCEMLVKAGAKLDLRNTYGLTPLFSAAEYGKDATLRFLLKHGADPNGQAADGATPLCEAAKNQHEKIVELLISHNADANIPGKAGLLPLHIAAQTGNDVITSMLIPVTSKARVRRTGISPLHLAAERNRDEVLELLIESGFDVNAQLSEERSRLYADRRSTALYFSVNNNNLCAAQALLSAGADPNLDLFRPLMVAARQSCPEAVSLLVEHGADVNAPVPTHPTTFPAVYMFSMKYLVLFKYLLDHGGHARSCFTCRYGDKSHPPIRTTRSERRDGGGGGAEEAQLGMPGVQFCEMISAPSISRWAGPIIDVLLDYVGQVNLCSRLVEHLDSYSEWSSIKDRAMSPRSLMQLCRLRVLQQVPRRRLNKLPLPGGLIRFLQHREGSMDD